MKKMILQVGGNIVGEFCEMFSTVNAYKHW